MDELYLSPIGRVNGTVRMPGSKSLSNRYLLLAAVSAGVSSIRNLLPARDIAVMLDALRQLGVKIGVSSDNTHADVTGIACKFSSSLRWPVAEAFLHLGNAGTAMRPLTAILAASDFGVFTLDGDKRMAERPIADLLEALRPLGADIKELGVKGYPPLLITAHGLAGGKITVAGDVSSQFLSALLMAAPFARSDLIIEVTGTLISRPYVDLTLKAMELFGVIVNREGYQRFEIPRVVYRAPSLPLVVEGDASSASYFLAAGAIRGGIVRVEAINPDGTQGDVRFAAVLEAMGATVRRGSEWIEVEGGRPLTAVDLDLNDMPDAAMTLAVTALFARGRTVIRNIGSWRVKETDRLTAMATELAKLGAIITEGEDYIAVEGPTTLRTARLETYDDHRMAMSLSLASLGSVPVVIRDPGCTSKTFPDYFACLARIAK